jgi:hypothetical protein
MEHEVNRLLEDFGNEIAQPAELIWYVQQTALSRMPYMWFYPQQPAHHAPVTIPIAIRCLIRLNPSTLGDTQVVLVACKPFTPYNTGCRDKYTPEDRDR